jgi:hypothetical protein
MELDPWIPHVQDDGGGGGGGGGDGWDWNKTAKNLLPNIAFLGLYRESASQPSAEMHVCAAAPGNCAACVGSSLRAPAAMVP